MSTLSVHRLENVQDFDMANTPFTTAFNAANGAYAVTNAAYNTTNTAYNFANTVNTFAYGVAVNSAAAFAAANNVAPQVTPAFLTGNLAYALANNAYASINSNWTVTNALYSVANSAYGAANNVGPQIAPTYNTANAAYGTANAAYAAANTKFSSSGGTISGAVEITADLTVHGNTRFIDQTTLSVGDPLIYLAANNYTSDVVDIGFIANYVNTGGANVHTGLYRSSGTKEYYLFYGYDKEPLGNYIDPTGNNITKAVLNADIRTSNLNLGGANTINWITSGYNTTNASYGFANSAYASINSNWTVTNTAYSVSNAAFLKANNALANTSGVSFAGDFYVPGNIGIGTTSPSTKLTVLSSTNAGIAVNDGTVNSILYNTNSLNGSLGTTTNHPFAFYTNNSERMRITETGNVTMGSTTAVFASKLTVTNSADYPGLVVRRPITISNAISVNNSYLYMRGSDNGYGLAIGNYSAVQWLQGMINDAPSLDISLNPSGGNVGIGTISPGYKLDVSGSVNAASILVNGANVDQKVVAAFNTANSAYSFTWDMTVKTSAFTASSNTGYFVNTTSGAVVVNLPSSPVAGARVTIVDYAGTSATNNIVLNLNGSKLNGITANGTINTTRASFEMIYADSTQGWVNYSSYIQTTPGQSYTAEYLIVAGGGGSGTYYPGGGGAGGLLGGSYTVAATTAYSITVGGGGAAAGGSIGGSSLGGSGGNSSAFGYTAIGGGGGGNLTTGGSGGSGGGGGNGSTGGGSGTAGQGNAGGNGSGQGGHSNISAGGGGGAGAAGTSGSQPGTRGPGGNGSSAYSAWGAATGTGENVGGTYWYAGGGGGGNSASGAQAAGGYGGGGIGGYSSGNVNGVAGTTNTGGGAGGGGENGSSGNGRAGGSGIVIVRYAGSQRGSGGTVTTTGGYTYHVFTTSGTFTA